MSFLIISSFIFSMNSLSTLSDVAEQNQNFGCGAVYHYSAEEICEQKNDSKLYHKYFNNYFLNPYRSFISQTTSLLKLPASKFSINQFDNLYDNHTSIDTWNSFNDLNSTFTTAKLSNFLTLKISWNDLLRKGNLDSQNISKYDDLLLRFYNIITKVYTPKSILTLTQSASINRELHYLGKTVYYDTFPATEFLFGSNFVNQQLINEAYRNNKITTDNSIVSITNNYAQALIYYVINTVEQRHDFNVYPINDKLVNNQNMQDHLCTSKTKDDCLPFHDVTSSLINYIEDNININYDNENVKKLLIPLLAVNSSESHRSWIANNVNLRDAFFTEAFNKWLGTKSNERDYAWQLLNEYFINVFPIVFKVL